MSLFLPCVCSKYESMKGTVQAALPTPTSALAQSPSSISISLAEIVPTEQLRAA